MKGIKVKCGACSEISLKKEWNTAGIENGKFIGGCPYCSGEFYDEVDNKDNTHFEQKEK